jgi:hypothetical protein
VESHVEELHVELSHEKESAASSSADPDSPRAYSCSSATEAGADLEAIVTSVTSVSLWIVASSACFDATILIAVPEAAVLAAAAPETVPELGVPEPDAAEPAVLEPTVSESASSAADAVNTGGFADRPASSTPSSSVPNGVPV